MKICALGGTILMKKPEKTNVMRLLEQHKIAYTAHFYGDTGAVSGTEVAAALGEDPSRVFKTLVTVGKSGGHYVFVLPVQRELDLRKAAAAVGEKNVEMIPQKQLLPLTGYVHGGCSPVGMKKTFSTVVDETAQEKETIFVSGGKIGCQIEAAPEELRCLVAFTYAELTDSGKG